MSRCYDPEVLRRGHQIERYRVMDLIGTGPASEVYAVEHPELGVCALKVLTADDPGLEKRLMQEGQAQAKIRHANIVRVTDMLTVGGKRALLMEYVDGPGLDEWLAGHRPTVEEALQVFRGVLKGVRAAHKQNLVHRDLKPANVLLAESKGVVVPRLTDFGLVKNLEGGRMTMQGATLGTPGYMAPEQIFDASSVGKPADMFALGCLLYELVTGVPAFAGDNEVEILANVGKVRFEPVTSVEPDLPELVVQAIDGLLLADPAQRLDCDALWVLLFVQPDPVTEQPTESEEAPVDARSLAAAVPASERTTLTLDGQEVLERLREKRRDKVRPLSRYGMAAGVAGLFVVLVALAVVAVLLLS